MSSFPPRLLQTFKKHSLSVLSSARVSVFVRMCVCVWVPKKGVLSTKPKWEVAVKLFDGAAKKDYPRSPKPTDENCREIKSWLTCWLFWRASLGGFVVYFRGNPKRIDRNIQSYHNTWVSGCKAEYDFYELAINQSSWALTVITKNNQCRFIIYLYIQVYIRLLEVCAP